jgi:hypothetical protein
VNAASEARDILHLSAIWTWQVIASGQSAPGIDPLALQQAICEALATSNGISSVEGLCEDWFVLTSQRGIACIRGFFILIGVS